jgi:hypothetical protein
MDHPCYRCGRSVEDGKAFCAECGAPQIRVLLPEPSAPSVVRESSPNDVPVFALDPPVAPGALGSPAFSDGIVWSRALKSCALAALISLVAMSLRLIVPLLATLGAGCLAVVFYYRRSPTGRIDARSGAQLGAVTGILSFAVFAVFFVVFLAVLQSGGQARQQMIDAMQQVAARSHDPQVQAFLDLLKTPEGLVAKLIVGMVGFLIISVAAGGVAGALTGAFLGRKNR